ncbi:MAG: hypothetical protein A3F69_05385 [Acidobacteria bacterium RIFCSPLOWO2_12_FULL_66_10]|nr:MAG: hypothetical protein A3F69_05385 [Acidobacteria bacterium RIFCSPLOWO2_12_FULL_66_10]
MKRILIVTCGLLVLALPALVSAQAVHPEASAKADLHVSQPLVVGTETLKPGDYKFQCITQDGQHYLVVTTERGKEVAKVPCTPEELGKKAEGVEFRSRNRPDGAQVLTAVRIKGETIAHRVVMNPAG